MLENTRLSAQKKQRRYYSGKQKRHTLKTQIIIDKATRKIICIVCGVGREHDFNLFKRSGVGFKASIECVGDKGYQGLQKRHARSKTPHKRRKKQPLTVEEKRENRALARVRVGVEHVIRRLKIWRILAERYRNRRRRHGLRVNLLAGIYNYELKHKAVGQSS